MKSWIKQNDIPAFTAFSGNIDVDSLIPYIEIAQTEDVKRVLGLNLYNKINTDYLNNSLTGVYEEIFNDYLIKMIVYFSCSHYLAFNGSKVSNNGIIKPEQSSEVKEINSLSARYNALANNVVFNFNEFAKLNSIPEYNTGCDTKRKTNIIPWH